MDEEERKREFNELAKRAKYNSEAREELGRRCLAIACEMAERKYRKRDYHDKLDCALLAIGRVIAGYNPKRSDSNFERYLKNSINNEFRKGNDKAYKRQLALAGEIQRDFVSDFGALPSYEELEERFVRAYDRSLKPERKGTTTEGHKRKVFREIFLRHLALDRRGERPHMVGIESFLNQKTNSSLDIELKKALSDGLNSLDEKGRFVVYSHIYRGLPISEIGGIMRITEEEVRIIKRESLEKIGSSIREAA